jgi:hypothetical protein
MELAFATRSLRALCEDEDRAAGLYGPTVAADLRARLADLRAAATVSDLIAGNPIFDGAGDAHLTLTLADTHVLICRVNHRNPARQQDGSPDWTRVRRLLIGSITEVITQ